METRRKVLKRRIESSKTVPHFGPKDLVKYVTKRKIGEGSFGVVFEAIDVNGKSFALKRMKCEEQCPRSALNEIKCLRVLKHNNIVKLVEGFRDFEKENNTIQCNIIYEFCNHDLTGLISNVTFSHAENKNILKQILTGLAYLHSNSIMHCDIKPDNILATSEGVVKLADFGLARNFPGKDEKLSYNIGSNGYRAPELVLGANTYGPEIDVFSAGSVMAELWTKTPIFLADSHRDDETLLFSYCGVPTESYWPGVEDLQFYKSLNFPQMKVGCLKKKMDPLMKDNMAYSLLAAMLTVNPDKRVRAASTLHHPYFKSKPIPKSIKAKLSRISGSFFS